MAGRSFTRPWGLVWAGLACCALSGCFSPTIGDGTIQCASDSQRSCPPGYQCGADNKCHKGVFLLPDAGKADAAHGADAGPDATPKPDSMPGTPDARPPDASPPDARVDAQPGAPPTIVLSGGGDSVANATTKLHLIIGQTQISTSADGSFKLEWGLLPTSKIP